jgi:hypothetical protein
VEGVCYLTRVGQVVGEKEEEATGGLVDYQIERGAENERHGAIVSEG